MGGVGFLSAFVVFDQLHDLAAQQEQSNQVGDGHDAVAGICDAPHETKIHGSAYD